MNDAAPAPPAKVPGFWAGLVMGPDSYPDEAACAFVGAQILMWAGVATNTFIDKHFPILDFATAEGSLVSIYIAFKTAQSRWRNP